MRTRLFALVALSSAALLPAQLAGSYVVGPGGAFANLTAAITALNTSGVSGPTTFVLTQSETGPWTINAFPGQGTANPVVFDGLGSAVLSGAQPVLTLNGCASVTWRGCRGTFTTAGDSILINAGTTGCVFTGCDFRAALGALSATAGPAVFNFAGGQNCRVEDSVFGGAWQSLMAAAASDAIIVQRCRIIGGSWRIMTFGGTNCVLVNNFITGNTNYGINAGIPSQPTTAANLKIWHNSVFINHPTSGSQYCSLRWYTNQTGTEVVNNIFFDFYPTLTTSTFNMWCSGALRPQLMNHNCLWSNQAGYFPVYASANQTFAAWQGLGFDVNSIQADPLYTAPTATPEDLRLLSGSPCGSAGTLLPAVTGDFFGATRTAPVSIGAHEDSGGAWITFGAGCAGSVGVATNQAVPPPRIGQTSAVTFGNLPIVSAVFMLVGVSNTTSVLGPLPFDMAGFGAPGCFARVSMDSTSFVIGAGGSATYNLMVPNLRQLVGMQAFCQGLVLDPGFNALSAITSNAAAVTIGL